MPLTEPLRLGILGGGLNSAVGQAHRVASQLDGRWRVIGGCFSRDPALNRASAEAWQVGGSRTFTSLEELADFAADHLDAVAVLTPTPSHFIQVTTLLHAGVNVICEKSLAGDLDDACEIELLANQRNTLVAVTFNYSAYPMVRLMQAWLSEGRLGEIASVELQMPQEGFIRRDPSGQAPRPQEWRQVDGPIPTVSLDLGVHLAHLAKFTTGLNPRAVAALSRHYGLVGDTVDLVQGLVSFHGGAMGSISYGKVKLGARNGLSITVVGDEGTLEWRQVDPEVLWYADHLGSMRKIDTGDPLVLAHAGMGRYQRFKPGHPSGFLEAFANLYWDIAELLRNGPQEGAPRFVPLAREGVEALELVSALAEASRSSQWVDVPRSSGDDQRLT